MGKCCISSEELVLLASTISISIAKGKDADTLDILGGLFQAIGQNLSLISSQKSICCDCDDEN